MQLTTFLIASLIHVIDGAKILGFFVSPNVKPDYYYPIFEELALRGHHVTLISPTLRDQSEIKNLHVEDISFVLEVGVNFTNIINEGSYTFTNTMNMFEFYRDTFKLLLKRDEVKTVLQQKFDVVIAEHVTPLTFIPSVLSGATTIGFSASSGPLHAHDSVSNPTHPVTTPSSILNMEGELSYQDRLNSGLYNIWYRLYYNLYELPKCDKIIKDYFGASGPYLGQTEKNVSLQIFYSNPILGLIRPNVANVVEISLANIKTSTLKDSAIKEFLDTSTHGIIYINLDFKDSKIEKRIVKLLCESLSHLPYHVLWNYNSRKNMNSFKFMVRPDLPQADILAHKNVKLFITDGDILSIEQSVINDVPLIGIPLYFDQKPYVNVIERKQIGKVIDAKNITEQMLKNTVVEVAECKKFKKNVQKVGFLLREEPAGLPKIIWWIEFIIRRKGATHIRSTAPNYYLYQYYFLDIIAFMLFTLGVLIFVIYFIINLFVKVGRMAFKLKLE
ncbi:unnamed protein product [Brassicogethes aeneus]|uniref:Uncharacterized protein n=1 Tax=Brassicogethes aeneus TaxID=1431903 RepID=A0A9P0FAM7_BRAAE|nr:unnamed protein product [Brassicogethes aeneus]